MALVVLILFKFRQLFQRWQILPNSCWFLLGVYSTFGAITSPLFLLTLQMVTVTLFNMQLWIAHSILFYNQMLCHVQISRTFCFWWQICLVSLSGQFSGSYYASDLVERIIGKTIILHVRWSIGWWLILFFKHTHLLTLKLSMILKPKSPENAAK